MNRITLLAVDKLAAPTLSAGELHYYFFTFNELAELCRRQSLNLAGLLSDQEETRARRFLNPLHGEHFRLARGGLRHLLGHYCRANSAALAFTYNEYGKPFLDLASSPELPDIQFNVSHSHEFCAYCFAKTINVGIDVEQHRELNNREDLQERICTENEIAYLQSLQNDEAQQAFYRLWCRKEAFVKAYGRGLSLGLNSIDVLEDVITYHNEAQNPSRWQLCDLPSHTGCGFACAYEL